MKHVLACATALVILAGCGKEPQLQPADAELPAPPADAASKTASKPRPRPVAAPEGERGMEDLASRGIELDFPHSTLYDIIDISGGGVRRHRVLIEVEQGDFLSAVQKLGDSLVATGYIKAADTNKSGRIDQVFGKTGQPAFYLLAQPAGMGPKLMKPESVGSIHIMWNMQ